MPCTILKLLMGYQDFIVGFIISIVKLVIPTKSG